MTRILGVLLAVTLAASASPVQACRGNLLVPQHGHADQYQVLLVEVTGVRLTDYEWYRAAELGLAPWPKADDGEVVLYPTSSTPGFKVNVLVKKATQGSSAPLREFDLGGCGIGVPSLKETGLIFVSPNGRHVGAVWSSQQPQFEQWLEELSLDPDNKP